MRPRQTGRECAAERLPQLFHDINQPLTSVRCSLEVSLLIPDVVRQRTCIEQAIRETDRVIEMLEALRSALET